MASAYVVLEKTVEGEGPELLGETWIRVANVEAARNQRHALHLVAQKLGPPDFERLAVTTRSWVPRGARKKESVVLT